MNCSPVSEGIEVGAVVEVSAKELLLVMRTVSVAGELLSVLLVSGVSVAYWLSTTVFSAGVSGWLPFPSELVLPLPDFKMKIKRCRSALLNWHRGLNRRWPQVGG